MGLQIRKIKVKDVQTCDEFQQLAQGHADEIRGLLGYAQVLPQWDMYSELEYQKHLLALGVFNERNQIVGYSINIVSPHLHYVQTTFCICDAIYVHPAYRGTGIGMKLIHTTEDEARALGCTLMNFHAKPGTAFHNILLHNKYFERDVILERNI